MITQVCFVSPLNFLDPLLTSDGEPYRPKRYKEIVNECFLICKFCNTSYTDAKLISPKEREYLLQFINDDLLHLEEAMQEALKKRKQ